MKFKILIVFLFLSISKPPKLFPQDILGGDLYLGSFLPNTYQANVYLYTKISAGINRSFIHFNWGDCCYGPLPKISEITVAPDVRLSLYSGFHTYPGPDTYTVSVLDSFRITNIINVQNSANEPFYLEYNLIIDPFIGSNSLAYHLNYQSDVSNNNGIISHDAVANDQDNDSLSYSIVACNTNGYSFPSPGLLTIDSVTGNFLWDSPIALGNYQVCIKAMEWRNGIIIGENIRDMTINVSSLTGLNEFQNDNSLIHIFPNPSKGKFTISLSGQFKIDIIIYDALGQPVWEKTNTSESSFTIDITDYPEGLYLIKVVKEGRNSVSKLVHF